MSNIIMTTIYFLSGIVLNTFCLYFCYAILEKKLNIKNPKNLLIILIMTIVEIVLDIYCPQPFKFILSFSFLIMIGYILTDRKFIDSLIMIILLEIVSVISEMMYSVVINIIVSDYSSTIVVAISNIIVPFIGTIILKTNIPKKIFKTIKKTTAFIKNREILTYSVMVILIIVISIIESYMNLPLSIVIITNTIMSLVLISIIVMFVTTKSNYQNISSKYQISINSLKEYEVMIDKFRVNSHENKNELMTIRNMIKSKDKKIIEYIDALVDNKIKDNEKIMYQTSKIPEGGLRATIYSKLCVMEKYKIKYRLDIAKDVRTVDLINISDDLILNVCKILGVFLDNAIEAVKNLKEKNIEIELYVIDNELYIDITNNYNHNLDINKIINEKHTTKGNGHGYGLLLVNKIVSENHDILKNETSINSKNFTQTLKIII